MTHRPDRLPQPIAEAIEHGGGRITMARFMELALSDPECGYYARFAGALGASGDFTTAPHRAPAFGRSVANVATQVLDLLLPRAPGGLVTVIEVGGGEGDLAAAMISFWEEHRPALRNRLQFRLVEIGTGLRTRQQRRLAEAIARGWHVTWASSLAELPPGAGLIVSNELVDALPVHLLNVQSAAVRECWVRRETGEAGGLRETWEEPSAEAVDELKTVYGTVETTELRPHTQDGILEVRPAAGVYLSQAAEVLKEGAVLTVDYGDWLPGPRETESVQTGQQISGSDVPAGEDAGPTVAADGQPLPDRRNLHGRTLRSYTRHQIGRNPLLLPGRQDLTADVDFRALHVHGLRLGFNTAVYCSLAQLLAASGAADELSELQAAASTSLDADIQAATLAALLDPDGLGGLFKAMLQTVGD